MQVTWDPEDESEPQTWQFDPEDVPFKRAKEIEKHFDGTYDQWVVALQTGDISARSVLLWYMLTHVHPKLRYQDLPNFRVRQLKAEMGVVELKRLWARVQRMKLSEEKTEAFETAFEADMRDAMDREGLDGEFTIVDGQLSIEGAEDLPKPA